MRGTVKTWTHFWATAVLFVIFAATAGPAGATPYSAKPEAERRKLLRKAKTMGLRGLDHLVRASRDPNEWIRSAAVEALGRLEHPRVIPLLIRALASDSDSLVRDAAAKGLGSKRDPRVIPALIRSVMSSRSSITAMKVLGDLKVRKAVPWLARALLRRKPGYKLSAWQVDALKALARMPDRRAVPAVIKALSFKHAKVRELALQYLERLPDRRALLALTALFIKERAAALKLDRIGTLIARTGGNGIPFLLRQLRARQPEYRRAVAQALGNGRDPRIFGALVAATKDRDWQVPCNAARSLGKLKDRRSYPLLVRMFKGRDHELAGCALEGLAELGDPRAVPHLLAALKSRRSNFRMGALNGLAVLKLRKYSPLIIRLLSDSSESVRLAAISALENLKDHRAVVPLLLRATRDRSSHIRDRAKLAVEMMDRAALPGLIRALRHRRWKIRRLASTFLGKLDACSAVPALIVTAERDRKGAVRTAALKALKQIGNPETHTTAAAWRRWWKTDGKRDCKKNLK